MPPPLGNQHPDGGVVEIVSPQAAFGLWRLDPDTELFRLLQGALDLDRLLLEVDIRPAQRQQLIAAHAGAGGEAQRSDRRPILVGLKCVRLVGGGHILALTELGIEFMVAVEA